MSFMCSTCWRLSSACTRPSSRVSSSKTPAISGLRAAVRRVRDTGHARAALGWLAGGAHRSARLLAKRFSRRDLSTRHLRIAIRKWASAARRAMQRGAQQQSRAGATAKDGEASQEARSIWCWSALWCKATRTLLATLKKIRPAWVTSGEKESTEPSRHSRHADSAQTQHNNGPPPPPPPPRDSHAVHEVVRLAVTLLQRVLRRALSTRARLGSERAQARTSSWLRSVCASRSAALS